MPSAAAKARNAAEKTAATAQRAASNQAEASGGRTSTSKTVLGGEIVQINTGSREQLEQLQKQRPGSRIVINQQTGQEQLLEARGKNLRNEANFASFNAKRVQEGSLQEEGTSRADYISGSLNDLKNLKYRPGYNLTTRRYSDTDEAILTPKNKGKNWPSEFKPKPYQKTRAKSAREQAEDISQGKTENYFIGKPTSQVVEQYEKSASENARDALFPKTYSDEKGKELFSITGQSPGSNFEYFLTGKNKVTDRKLSAREQAELISSGELSNFMIGPQTAETKKQSQISASQQQGIQQKTSQQTPITYQDSKGKEIFTITGQSKGSEFSYTIRDKEKEKALNDFFTSKNTKTETSKIFPFPLEAEKKEPKYIPGQGLYEGFVKPGLVEGIISLSPTPRSIFGSLGLIKEPKTERAEKRLNDIIKPGPRTSSKLLEQAITGQPLTGSGKGIGYDIESLGGDIAITALLMKPSLSPIKISSNLIETEKGVENIGRSLNIGYGKYSKSILGPSEKKVGDLIKDISPTKRGFEYASQPKSTENILLKESTFDTLLKAGKALPEDKPFIVALKGLSKDIAFSEKVRKDRVKVDIFPETPSTGIPAGIESETFVEKVLTKLPPIKGQMVEKTQISKKLLPKETEILTSDVDADYTSKIFGTFRAERRAKISEDIMNSVALGERAYQREGSKLYAGIKTGVEFPELKVEKGISYHGTSKEAAKNIITKGVDITKSQRGSGFFTASRIGMASGFAKRAATHSEKAVLKIDLKRSKLLEYNKIPADIRESIVSKNWLKFQTNVINYAKGKGYAGVTKPYKTTNPFTTKSEVIVIDKSIIKKISEVKPTATLGQKSKVLELLTEKDVDELSSSLAKGTGKSFGYNLGNRIVKVPTKGGGKVPEITLEHQMQNLIKDASALQGPRTEKFNMPNVAIDYLKPGMKIRETDSGFRFGPIEARLKSIARLPRGVEQLAQDLEKQGYGKVSTRMRENVEIIKKSKPEIDFEKYIKESEIEHANLSSRFSRITSEFKTPNITATIGLHSQSRLESRAKERIERALSRTSSSYIQERHSKSLSRGLSSNSIVSPNSLSRISSKSALSLTNKSPSSLSFTSPSSKVPSITSKISIPSFSPISKTPFSPTSKSPLSPSRPRPFSPTSPTNKSPLSPLSPVYPVYPVPIIPIIPPKPPIIPIGNMKMRIDKSKPEPKPKDFVFIGNVSQVDVGSGVYNRSERITGKKKVSKLARYDITRSQREWKSNLSKGFTFSSNKSSPPTKSKPFNISSGSKNKISIF